MRLVFVSRTHPSVPHVSSQRASQFAAALARRGHQVILLTATYGQDPLTSAEIKWSLANHDWRTPLHITCSAPESAIARLVRNASLPTILRRPITAFLSMTDGPFPEWPAAARRASRVIAADYKIDAVWSVFGNISDIVAGRAISRVFGCPYVIDFKDNWQKFIKPALRTLVASRFSDVHSYTANAARHLDAALHYFPHRDSTVVYSGVSAQFLDMTPTRKHSCFNITLTGSFYNDENLRRYSDAIAGWLSRRNDAELLRIAIIYAGTEKQKFDDAFRKLPCGVYSYDQLPVEQLAALVANAAVNTYLWCNNCFHHKLLELISIKRPILSFPGELDESINLAAKYSAYFVPCNTECTIIANLDRIWHEFVTEQSKSVPVDIGQRLDWDYFAADLEGHLHKVGGDAKGRSAT